MKYLKEFKLFEKYDEDNNLIARSIDWTLYCFNDISDYVQFDKLVSPENPLMPRVPFSVDRDKILSQGISTNNYNPPNDNYFDNLFLFINYDETEFFVLTVFKNGTINGPYDKLDRRISLDKLSPILKDMDFISSDKEEMMNNLLKRSPIQATVANSRAHAYNFGFANLPNI